MVWLTFGINQPRESWRFWNCPRFTREISKFSKMRSANLSQTTLPYMWFLVKMHLLVKEEVKEHDTFRLSPKHQNLIVSPVICFSIKVESKRTILENQENNGIITLYWKCENKYLSINIIESKSFLVYLPYVLWI